jgi:hypothetical protein
VSRVLGWSLVFVLLTIGIFTFPKSPSPGLDPSWRMAMGYFYEKGLQFGQDVIFTYGPLGFIMAKTFSGFQFWSLIVGQLLLALVSSAVILRQGLRLPGAVNRLVYFLFFFVFAMLYEDAMHMIVLTILGYDLLRSLETSDRLQLGLIAAVLAAYAQIKFTDCLLAAFIVVISVGYGLSLRRPVQAAWIGVTFILVYLAIWLGCHQELANLPAYFRVSWEISDGYQWAMAIPSPFAAFWKGLLVLLVIATYGISHLFLNPNKPRAWANSLLLGAYIYLNWKHGFVRADGHMIGFFFCAILPLVSYPVLLDDPDRFRFAHRWTFVVTLVLSICALENALEGCVHSSLGWMEDKIWGNVVRTINWQDTRQAYRDQLSVARAGADLPQTRKVIGNATVDVLGSEQSMAIFNQFNYRPRPVFQGYSTYLPVLARLNGDFFASDRAPDFVLMRMESIDGRFMMMDDAQVMVLLPYRYEYVLSEKSFQLWRRLPAPFDPARLVPKTIRAEEAAINQTVKVEDLLGKPTWVTIDLPTSLLGKIRSFFYKLPEVRLNILENSGGDHDYPLPLPMGRNGFVLNPIIGDTVDYMRYASDQPHRYARALTVKVAAGDARYFAGTARVEFSALPPPATTGAKFFPKDIDQLFPMFRTRPIAYESQTGYSAAKIDDRDVVVMHAPSLMTFAMPDHAKSISGRFGMLAGTYTGEGKTNGARFIVYWSNGTDHRDLFQQYLDPVKIPEDRGLHEFSVNLTGLSGGSIYLQVHPGPYNDIAWDWTAWTDVYIAQ